jgi:DNA-binding transcriptional MerR regulator
MGTTGKPLRSGELAYLTGVSSDTLRHYERLGVLSTPLRTTSGYRVFARDVIERVRVVRRALQLGFTLAELSEILRARDSGKVPCHHVLILTKRKLRDLELQIQELHRAQRYMRQLVRHWQKTLVQKAPGTKALLLQSLRDRPKLRVKPVDYLKRSKRS